MLSNWMGMKFYCLAKMNTPQAPFQENHNEYMRFINVLM